MHSTKGQGKPTRQHGERGILDDICGHMTQTYSLMRKWTLEAQKIEALRYQTRTEFSQRVQSGAYNGAARKKWAGY